MEKHPDRPASYFIRSGVNTLVDLLHTKRCKWRIQRAHCETLNTMSASTISCKREQQQDEDAPRKRPKWEFQMDAFPPDVLVRILLHCTVQDLASVACLNRLFREVVSHPKLSQELWFSYTIPQNTSIQALYNTLHAMEERGWFRRFPQLRLIGCHHLQKVSRVKTAPERRFLTGLQLSCTRLDLSLDSTLLKKDRKVYAWVCKFLADAMPRLTHVDMSYMDTTSSSIESFARSCPNLQSFTWKSCTNADAFVFRSFRSLMNHPSRITKVIMDDAKLFTYQDVESEESDQRILSYLQSTLQQVSLKNLSYYGYGQPAAPASQPSLVKFVRSMPHLVWLRSDLDPTNVAMLQAERPEIEFVQ